MPSRRTPGKASVPVPAASPDGTLYVGSLDDNVYALNGTTGAEIWSFATGNNVYTSPAIGSDGTVYFGSYDDSVYALGTGGFTGVSVSPTSVVGGAVPVGTVTFASAAPSLGDAVTVSSSDASVTVPTPVTVTSGNTSATFNVTTTGVDSQKSVTISASFGGTTYHSTLTVKPPSLISLVLSPVLVTSGEATTGKVYLSGPAGPSGLSASLTDGASSVISIPGPASISAGASSSATFSITNSGVNTTTPVTVTATLGSVSKSCTMTVYPAIVSRVTLSPTTVVGGSGSNGTVYLSGPAGPLNASVSLQSSSAAAGVPMNVTVNSGSSSATFQVTTSAVTASTPLTITATLGSSTKQVAMLVEAPLARLTLNPSSVVGGVNSDGVVLLSVPASGAGAIVSITSSNPLVASVQPGVRIVSGSIVNSFPIKTFAVTQSTQVTITVNYGASSASQVLTVTP